MAVVRHERGVNIMPLTQNKEYDPSPTNKQLTPDPSVLCARGESVDTKARNNEQRTALRAFAKPGFLRSTILGSRRTSFADEV